MCAELKRTEDNCRRGGGRSCSVLIFEECIIFIFDGCNVSDDMVNMLYVNAPGRFKSHLSLQTNTTSFYCNASQHGEEIKTKMKLFSFIQCPHDLPPTGFHLSLHTLLPSYSHRVYIHWIMINYHHFIDPLSCVKGALWLWGIHRLQFVFTACLSPIRRCPPSLYYVPVLFNWLLLGKEYKVEEALQDKTVTMWLWLKKTLSAWWRYYSSLWDLVSHWKAQHNMKPKIHFKEQNLQTSVQIKDFLMLLLSSNACALFILANRSKVNACFISTTNSDVLLRCCVRCRSASTLIFCSSPLGWKPHSPSVGELHKLFRFLSVSPSLCFVCLPATTTQW